MADAMQTFDDVVPDMFDPDCVICQMLAEEDGISLIFGE